MTRPTRRSISILAAILVLVVGGGQGSRCAAATRGSIDAIEVGFGGVAKVGYWTPVWVTLSAADEPLEGRLQLGTIDGDGVNVGYLDAETAAVRLGAGESARVVRYVKFGRRQASLTVSVQDGEELLVRRVFPVSEFAEPQESDRLFLLTIGSSMNAAQAASNRDGGPGGMPLAAQLSKVDQLPDRWFGYESVDRLILTTRDNAILTEMDDLQFAALEQWVKLGGRLVLTVGARGDEIAATGPDRGVGRLIRFFPGKFAAMGLLRNASALESFAGSSQALDLTAPGLPLTVLADVQGKVELSDTGVRGWQPLVVSATYGFGQVTFAAIDLDQPPFDGWEGRSRLLARLLRDDGVGAGGSGARQQGGKVTHVGYTDMSGQLRSALDQFPGVSLVPFYWVAGLVLTYILLIGPGDYFFLQRIIRHMPATWISFPIIVVLFSVLSLVLHQRLKVADLRVNQVDLIDVDVQQRLLRGTTWADIYSPSTEIYDIQWTTDQQTDPIWGGAGEPQFLCSWQGLPGTGLGGLNTTAAPPTFSTPYLIAIGDTQSQFVDVPIQVAATKTFQGRWWGATKALDAGELRENADGLLQGTIANPLPFALADCVVLYSNWMYRLDSKNGILESGDTANLKLEQPLNLEWRLTKRRVEETRDVSTPWNQNDLDVDRILQMMMFHNAAGGDKYTQLTHRYQSFTDLSHQLRRGRAILAGRTTSPATRLRIDRQPVPGGQEQHWTFCRLTVPVTAWQSASDPLEQDRLDRARADTNK